MTVVGTQELAPPAFYCPIPPASHSQAADFDGTAVRWLRRHALADPEQCRWLSRADLGGLTARTMPNGASDLLHVVARLHAVLFALDDMCDEDGAGMRQRLSRETQRIVRVLESPHPTWPDDSVYAKALREIRLQLADHLTDSQLRRWTEGMRTYLSSLVLEAEYRRTSTLPTLDDYVTMWMCAIGMAPSTALLDAVAGHEVPDRELDDPGVRACTEMTWVLVSWDNDLYSRPKEIGRAGDTLNLVDVLAKERGLSLADAQEEAVQMRDRVMVCFLALREQLMARAGDGTRRYLTDLGHFLRGHLDWARTCSRYAPDGDARDPAGRQWWRDHPLESGLQPVPLAPIAGWWAHVAE